MTRLDSPMPPVAAETATARFVYALTGFSDTRVSPPVQVRGGGVVQGGAPPLVSGVHGGATSHQSLQTLVVTAGGGVVQRRPGVGGVTRDTFRTTL